MNILGTKFKVCEGFGGWGTNGAADSSCYCYGWEEYNVFVKKKKIIFIFLLLPMRNYRCSM